MLLLDAMLRMSAVTLLMLLAIVAVRDIRDSRSWIFLLLACLSTAALFLRLSSPELEPQGIFGFILGFASVPHLVLVWLFALSVFQTNFRLSPHHIIIGVIYTFPIFWFRAYQFELIHQPPFFLTILVSVGSILFVVHLVWNILKERNDDLIEERKQSRLSFVVVLVAVTALTAIVDLYLIKFSPEWDKLIKAATIWPAVFAAALWMLYTSKTSFVSKRPQNISLAQTKVSAKDRQLYDALQNRLKERHVYLNADLTITQLSKDLGVTPHRLRSLINQALGYENFNQFLNSHRIASILKKFDDSEFDHIPILTIALDNGFRSLSPFNTSFKNIVGQTPSQYRKRKNKE